MPPFGATVRAARAEVLRALLFNARGLRSLGRRPVFCPGCGKPAAVFLSAPLWVYGIACSCGVRVSNGALVLFGRN